MSHYLDVAKIKQELEEALTLYRNELVRIEQAEAVLEEDLVRAVEGKKIDTLKQKLI